MHYITIILTVWLLAGCANQEKKIKYDGNTLMKEKCISCHNLKMPPDTYADEKAPPMMAVVFHLKDFMKIKIDSEKLSKFIPFIQDYVINPSAEKSYCDKESLKTYGVMPSQKEKVTKDELKAIASYMYDFYDQQKYLKQMQEKLAFEALPKGEQLARKNGCFNCHSLNKVGAGPSFKQIAKKDSKEIIEIIKEGSKGRWKDFHVVMPSFKSRLSEKDIEILQTWIQKPIKKEKKETPNIKWKGKK